MKQLSLVAGLASLLIVAGCGHPNETVVTGADGSKAVISGNTAGGQLDVTGKDGEHVKETFDNNGNAKFDITDKNGQKATETMSSNGVSMTNSKGDVYKSGAGVVTESDLGLPFYPGSDDSKTAGMSAISTTDTGKSVSSCRTTKDDPDKVATFYKDKIPGAKSSSVSTGGGKMVTLSGNLANGAKIDMIVSSDGKTDTQITLISVTKKP